MKERRRQAEEKRTTVERRSARGARGRDLPASSVRAFLLHSSCPSFGCFHGRHLVGSFTPGRRAERARARKREREQKGEKRSDSKRERGEESGEEGGRSREEEKEGWQKRGREKEEEEGRRGVRRHVRLAVQPTTEATSAGARGFRRSLCVSGVPEGESA